MQWDIFCRVIDNYGDVGVCWRLVRTLVARGEQVRLWLDDDQALRWMAPWQPGEASAAGVQVMPWGEAETPQTANEGLLLPGDVVIEAFGCELPQAFVALMKARQDAGLRVEWVNLEYLSAENYVERSHGLRSPVMSGPGQGLRKRFFYPGFTARTGGLLQAAAPSSTERTALRQRLLTGWAPPPAPSPSPFAKPGADAIGHPWVLAFCYDNAPLPTVLSVLARQAASGDWPTVHVWLTPGPATALGGQWLADQQVQTATAPEADQRPCLALHALPRCPQHVFDQWLDACDLNLVRGEDSAARALWPGQPHLWQLYVQDDGVHGDKMSAFTDRWMADWPADLRQAVLPWWRLWNGLTGAAPPASTLTTLPDWWSPPGQAETPWARAQAQSAQALRSQTDLTTQLMAFVNLPG
jgi:uncharacterized repeat protein (TIGR03837 family)